MLKTFCSNIPIPQKDYCIFVQNCQVKRLPMMFADKIKQLREQNNLLQRQLSAALEIDNGLYSKIERGERRAKREQVVKLAEILKVDQEELLTLWLADQVYTVVKGENNANKVLNVVQENMVEYGKNKYINQVIQGDCLKLCQISPTSPLI